MTGYTYLLRGKTKVSRCRDLQSCRPIQRCGARDPSAGAKTTKTVNGSLRSTKRWSSRAGTKMTEPGPHRDGRLRGSEVQPGRRPRHRSRPRCADVWVSAPSSGTEYVPTLRSAVRRCSTQCRPWPASGRMNSPASVEHLHRGLPLFGGLRLNLQNSAWLVCSTCASSRCCPRPPRSSMHSGWPILGRSQFRVRRRPTARRDKAVVVGGLDTTSMTPGHIDAAVRQRAGPGTICTRCRPTPCGVGSGSGAQPGPVPGLRAAVRPGGTGAERISAARPRC